MTRLEGSLMEEPVALHRTNTKRDNIPLVMSSLRLFEDSACSHRLRGLPSSSGSPSLLHLRALAPQRHVASSWQRTVEPQPPPHACSVVAWPIARQGFYGGQPTVYPTDPSPGRSHSPHPNMTGSYDEPPNLTISQSLNITVSGGRNYPSDQQPKSLQCLLSQVHARL